MKNKILVKKVCVDNTRIAIEFRTTGIIQKLFNSSTFFLDYSENVKQTPISIAVIPFVTNVLPIIWLTNSELIVPELDKTFYEHIDKIKNGYIKLSPMLNWGGGQIVCDKIIDNSLINNSNSCAMLFSGGLDAFATLVKHYKERPILFTVWGSDISLSDSEGWGNVWNHVEHTAKDFSLPSPVSVKSNFRTFIREGRLDKLTQRKSGEKWWHGYQHGIGLIGLIAPITYNNLIKTVYIASSYTEDDHVICASSPYIDNNCAFASTKVSHDLYECKSIEKAEMIVDYCKENKHNIELRVCWQSWGGTNCCRCEKCLRRMYELMAVGGKVSNFGFKKESLSPQQIQSLVTEAILLTPHLKYYWLPIQKRMQRTSEFLKKKETRWICETNFNTIQIPYPFFRLTKKIKKLCNIIKQHLQCV